jgi:hypothetical protein
MYGQSAIQAEGEWFLNETHAAAFDLLPRGNIDWRMPPKRGVRRPPDNRTTCRF